MKLTRRELAAALAPAALAAQTQPAAPATPAELLTAAQARLKASSAALARREVPMAVEPAFQFKA